MADVEIHGDTVKSAVGKQLKTIFPDITWYKDSITIPKYPNFFVNQLQLTAVPDTLNRWWLNYLFSVEYRHATDVTTVQGLNTVLDEIAMQLFANMDTLNDVKVRTSNSRAEKSEGLLVFIFNVKLRVRKEVIEVLQNELGLDITIESR
ncbi:phage tail terminator family protein [Anaerosinus massiliensis]|uniref:phage tail terminator family protein n=1 Tax=Massilibacillus massiliensis TaxID=1806837 RepID=UPI000DA607FC|nr:hypothetical protein [Massilibacillus massiliensis]